jgi:hypothetical protein
MPAVILILAANGFAKSGVVGAHGAPYFVGYAVISRKRESRIDRHGGQSWIKSGMTIFGGILILRDLCMTVLIRTVSAKLEFLKNKMALFS